MQVGRDRQDPGGVQDVGERVGLVVPREFDQVRVPMGFLPVRRQRDRLVIDEDRLGQGPLLPFLEVPDQTGPAATPGLLEDQGVIMGLDRLQAENLDACAGLFPEKQAGLYDSGIIEYHQGLPGQEIRDALKYTLAYFPVAVEQELGLIPPGQGELGYSFVG